jgi:hypothetical protein
VRNPAISAVWPKMTSRQRWAAMEFAGVGEERARSYSHEEWIDLPEDVKGLLLRGWNMGSLGGTRRRSKGETTRRMPVLTNPVAKPFEVQGSHSYLLSFKGGGWKVYESYDTHADALDMAKWLMKGGVAGVKGRVQTLVLRPTGERRYLVFYRRTRRVAANGTKGAYPFAAKQRQYRSYTMSQLRYALKDAADTARIWKGQDPAVENWYKDDVFTISDEIRRREGKKNPLTPEERGELERHIPTYDARMWDPKAGAYDRGYNRGVRETLEHVVRKYGRNPSVPVWMRSEEAFFQKFGATRERLAKALARLTDAQKQEFHKRVDKTFSESAVRWALKQGGMGSLPNGTQELPVEAGLDLMRRAVKFLRRRGVKARVVKVEPGRYRVRVGAGHDVEKLTRLVDQGPWKPSQAAEIQTDRQMAKYAASMRRHGGIYKPGQYEYTLKARAKQMGLRKNSIVPPRIYYVAQYAPAYPMKGRRWMAAGKIDYLPPTVVGKVFKIAARSAREAIKEAQAIQ